MQVHNKKGGTLSKVISCSLRVQKINEITVRGLELCKIRLGAQNVTLLSTLLCEVTINFIGKCFFFFHPHLRIKSKASAYMSRHLHIKSKTSAYTIGTCFRFYMQMPLDI